MYGSSREVRSAVKSISSKAREARAWWNSRPPLHWTARCLALSHPPSRGTRARSRIISTPKRTWSRIWLFWRKTGNSFTPQKTLKTPCASCIMPTTKLRASRDSTKSSLSLRRIESSSSSWKWMKHPKSTATTSTSRKTSRGRCSLNSLRRILSTSTIGMVEYLALSSLSTLSTTTRQASWTVSCRRVLTSHSYMKRSSTVIWHWSKSIW